MRRTFATTLTAGLLLLGCTAAGDADLLDVRATEDPAPEPPEEPEPDPEPDDPYAVPDEIDEAYVELVINAILEVRSEILRGALQQEQGENLDPELVALHFATTEGTERAEALRTLQDYIDDPETRGGLLAAQELGVSTFHIEYLHHAEPDRCVLALGFWDRTGTSRNAPTRAESVTAFSLSRTLDESEASPGNPTPWQWRDNRGLDGSVSPADFATLPWADELDHTCDTIPSEEGAER
jgi:hypothetical protein